MAGVLRVSTYRWGTTPTTREHANGTPLPPTTLTAVSPTIRPKPDATKCNANSTQKQRNSHHHTSPTTARRITPRCNATQQWSLLLSRSRRQLSLRSLYLSSSQSGETNGCTHFLPTPSYSIPTQNTPIPYLFTPAHHPIPHHPAPPQSTTPHLPTFHSRAIQPTQLTQTPPQLTTHARCWCRRMPRISLSSSLHWLRKKSMPGTSTQRSQKTHTRTYIVHVSTMC